MVGFDAKNKDIISLLYLCPICHLILREPVQLGCGHRQCKTCTESIDENIIKCTECQEETPKNQVIFDRGFINDMKLLTIICSLCEWNGYLRSYEEHLYEAHPNPMCEFCGERFNSTTRLDEHKHKECLKITVACAQKDYGCLASVCRVQLAEPYLTDFHQTAIINNITPSGVNPSNEQREGEGVPVVDIGMGETVPSSMVIPIDINSSARTQEIHEIINILTNGIEILNDDIRHLNNESIRLQNSSEYLTQACAQFKANIEEQNAWLRGFGINQEILLQELASLKQQVHDVKQASYNGILIWKITNFHEKMINAQTGRQRSIYSPPFYSSPTGYKMRARLFLYGDGTGTRTHLSLYFLLMRGKYDAILPFPFNFKIIFCLFDQTPQQQHIIHALLPDRTFGSFQRPILEMNNAYGLPQFFPLQTILQEGNSYVRDDTMFIKVMVDFGIIPENLLRYALSLSPDIPMHIQQIMIQKEAERRAQQ